MRLAVIGSRQFDDYGYLKAALEPYKNTATIIISGGAKGADSLAAQWARENKIPLMEIVPDYGRYGVIAPIIRNGIIVDECDGVVAFWDGESHGTLDTIRKAIKAGKTVFIRPFRVEQWMENAHLRK